MPPKRKRVSTHRVLVATGDDSPLCEGQLDSSISASNVQWEGLSGAVPCFLQCTFESDGMTVNVWQTALFDPDSTPISDVVDLALYADELTVYPVIFQPVEQDETCTPAKLLRSLIRMCCNVTTGLTEASIAAGRRSTIEEASEISEDEEDNNNDDDDNEDNDIDNDSFVVDDDDADDADDADDDECGENVIADEIVNEEEEPGEDDEDDGDDDEDNDDDDDAYSDDE